MDNSTIHINITDEASAELATLIVESNQNADVAESFLRVWVSGGGCSGLQYQMALWLEKEDDDLVVEVKDIKVLVDRQSAQYLDQATIEYSNGENSPVGFKITNPNFKSTCGCGSSFESNEEQNHRQCCQGCKT